MVNVDISEKSNPKQVIFLEKVLAETNKTIAEGYKYFFYGGAVRGGKTYVSLTILVILALKYKNSRWHIIRNTLANLKTTTIPSMEKILYGANVKWHRNPSDYYLEFDNGSRIYFFAEQISQDPDLARFKGLETNGFFLEQTEELSLKTWEKAKERLGSWKIPQLPLDENPPPILLATFNPTNTWLKTEIYDKYEKGELHKPYFYLSALPTDNAFNEKHQYETWANLDTKNYERFIKGSWDYEDDKLRFCYSFDPERHIQRISINKRIPFVLCFDFGKNPNVCIVIQSNFATSIAVVKEFSSKEGLIDLMAKVIHWLKDNNIKSVTLTGDASGATFSQYKFIEAALKQNKIGFNAKVPKSNPQISDSRILTNSILEKLDTVLVDIECKNLIRDLKFTEVFIDEGTGKLSIVKSGANSTIDASNTELSHNLDPFRYFIWVFFKWFIKKSNLI